MRFPGILTNETDLDPDTKWLGTDIYILKRAN